MKTEVIKIDVNNIDHNKIKYLGDIIKDGGLVAFPTETVYGLGANGLNNESIKKIFEAKGRPSDNPLILHIDNIISINSLVNNIPPITSELIEKYWPGPLTLIFEKSEKVPSIITAGLNTVAIRMPSHPIALALIKEAGVPIAAPSANISGRPSPTQAKHVINDLFGFVDAIIDADNSRIGVESTVLDITVNPPVILRPGGILEQELENIIKGIKVSENNNEVPKCPGMKYTHYSPKAELIIINGDLTNIINKINQEANKQMKNGKKIGIMETDQTINMYAEFEVISVGDRDNPETIATNLFSILRQFDERQVDLILAESIDTCGIGFAIMNRLNKAAGLKIINA